jgi:hypothetical protein
LMTLKKKWRWLAAAAVVDAVDAAVDAVAAPVADVADVAVGVSQQKRLVQKWTAEAPRVRPLALTTP